jgi:hypothetical protein
MGSGQSGRAERGLAKVLSHTAFSVSRNVSECVEELVASFVNLSNRLKL